MNEGTSGGDVNLLALSRTTTYVFIIAVVIAPTLWRAWDVYKIVYSATGQDSMAFIEVLRNDAPLVGIVLFLLVLTAMIRNRYLACIPFVGATIVQLAMMSDLVIQQQFSQRLNWLDLIKFYDYAITYMLAFNGKLLAAILLGVLIFLALAHLIFKSVHRINIDLKYTIPLLLVIALVPTLLWQGRSVKYVHYQFYQNFISYNQLLASEAVSYSDDFAKTVSDQSENICSSYPVLSGPVIVYMAESLSSYQSEFFGGINNWMPRLDEIAKSNAALTQFYANGFTTEDGELSLITAEQALYPPNSYSIGGSSAFAGYWTPDRSLPRIFNDRDYESTFLTTSDLTFSSTGDWMSAIGFQNVRGSNDPFYDGMERFHFGAAADAALVNNILQTVANAQATPFIFAKSVTSHHPHIHPETGERSVEAVVRYSDAQIGALYDGLYAQNFFDTGHLVIVGDHRAMLPITSGEVEKLGLAKAYTQVPAVVVSRQIAPNPITITTAYAQTDLSNTLMGLFGGEACNNAFQGMIWGATTHLPDYVLHRRGDQRNQISVFAQEGLGIITLGGDNTSFSGNNFFPEDKDIILRYVNAARIAANLAEQGRPANE